MNWKSSMKAEAEALARRQTETAGTKNLIGVGIAGKGERTRLLKGTLSVESGGVGTVVRASFPHVAAGG